MTIRPKASQTNCAMPTAWVTVSVSILQHGPVAYLICGAARGAGCA